VHEIKKVENHWVKGYTGHTPSAQLKGTMHQEPSVKSEDSFFEKQLFSEK